MTARRTLTHDDVRRIALSLPETTEGSHMGHPDLRVAGKIFIGLRAKDGNSVSLKSTAMNVDALVREDPETYRNAWGGKWLGVKLDRVDRAKLRALIEEAWSLAAPKKLRAGR
jgi:hypothetical protein